MNFPRLQARFSLISVAVAMVWVLGVAQSLYAHPDPDIPVRGIFHEDGTMTISVEVDTRCLKSDPSGAPYLLNVALLALPLEERNDMQDRAEGFVERLVEFMLEPIGRVQPEFKFRYTGKNGAELKGPEDVVVLTGEWKTTLAAGLTGWKVRSLPQSKLSVKLQNVINGKVHPRLHVLFPGEVSYTLDLSELVKSSPAAHGAGGDERIKIEGSAADYWSTFFGKIREGFVHVVPLGWDHILFVLGIFLLSRLWKPVLLQVTTFTVAHSVTLALATLGLVNLDERDKQIVEVVIAASIAVVAVENIVRPRYTHWRLLVVFAFGLIHGLGFATVLQEKGLPPELLAVGLTGFNIGVEGGQVAVIAAAFLATVWLRDPAKYRRWIAIPGSMAIGLIGLVVTIQRIQGMGAE